MFLGEAFEWSGTARFSKDWQEALVEEVFIHSAQVGQFLPLADALLEYVLKRDELVDALVL